jgi:carbonic anhydrase
VPPEFVFDESLGQLFTVRDEGTMADSAALGSIEFAAQRYHVKLLVILGHTACDAMNPPGAATAQRSSPAVGKAKISDGSETTRAEIIQHVHQQIDACRMHSTVLRDLIDNNELKVVGAVYNLDTGEVEFQ